jgi:hypothetical protein
MLYGGNRMLLYQKKPREKQKVRVEKKLISDIIDL